MQNHLLINCTPAQRSWRLNFLEKSMHPDIACAVHQCAHFSADPKQSHVAAVKGIRCYLKGMPNDGIMLHPDAQQKAFNVGLTQIFQAIGGLRELRRIP